MHDSIYFAMIEYIFYGHDENVIIFVTKVQQRCLPHAVFSKNELSTALLRNYLIVL